MTSSPVATTSADAWNDLVTVSLLGTDRRDPPELPAGPVADVVDDAVRPVPQSRLLASVAAMGVARRCGALPLPSCPPLMPPPSDDRPMLPVVAARRWREIVTHWPVLESEWLAVATARGWGAPPDVIVSMLRRHRRNAQFAAAVVRFGGPLIPWLFEHVPDIEPFRPPRRPDGAETADVRVLPVPAELDPLFEDAGAFAGALADGLAGGTFKWSHRAVLLNAVARLPRHALDTVIGALTRARDTIRDHDAADHGPPVAPLSLYESLIELAVVRRDMLNELEPAS